MEVLQAIKNNNNFLKVYSPGIMFLKHLAAVNTQSLASLVIFCSMTGGGVCLFLKTRAFLLFQISQAMRKVMEAKSLHLVIICHH
jgi:hypothetical protein